MEKQGKKGSTGPRSKYVWDPNKLAWIETTETEEEPVKEEAKREETRQEKTITEAEAVVVSEEAVEEVEPVEAAAEPLGLEYRGVLIRLVGILIDLLIVGIVMYIIDQFVNVPTVARPALGFVYFVGFWTWRGQTPGKWIIGSKVVKTDGRPITIINAVVRFIFYLIPAFGPILYFVGLYNGIIPILLAFISLLVIGFSGNKRGIHDLIAGTCVVTSRLRVLQPEIAEPSSASSEADEPDTTKQD